MGLLDSLAGQLAGAVGGGQQSGLMDAVGALLQNHPGGLAGLADSFKSQGLGEVIGSWIGTGQNLPISAEQLQSVLGSEQVQAIASRLGIDPAQAAGHLAEMLPQVIDRLTPNGTLPEHGALGGLLGGLLGGMR